ncbi:MAG: PSD1 and planctomycete cytochrome C domain-containing protein [Pirellulaceae bacterium]
MKSLFIAIFLLAVTIGNHSLIAQDSSIIEFNRDIRPILADKCFTCHGNDAGTRKPISASIELKRQRQASSGEIPIVPGEPRSSEIIRRIVSDDEYEQMPPAESKKKVSPEELALLERWIAQGAKYQPHWAFVAPKKVVVPQSDAHWSNQPIDQFVHEKMRGNGLQPSPVADRATLIRRVTLDLTGLPPTPDELKAFLADNSPEAYERLVDRLLGSTAYGEHMTRFWLDAARYGDTHGLHLDNYREIWPYRDWVIHSFNHNMPWNEFTIKNLAGDLLPEPSQEDLIASGFNRLHVTTNEGGAIPEEVFVRNVVDRVSTTGTVFMGMTWGCAVCHDHKYDPISSDDFYSMYSYFNSLDDNPMDQNAKDHAPVISVMTDEGRMAFESLKAEREQLVQSVDDQYANLHDEREQWEQRMRSALDVDWFEMHPESLESSQGATLEHTGQGIVLSSGENPDKDVYRLSYKLGEIEISALRLDVLVDESKARKGGGRSPNANAVLSEVRAYLVSGEGEQQEKTPVSISSVTADYSQPTYSVQNLIDGVVDATNGWGIGGHLREGPCHAILLLNQPVHAPGKTLELELEFGTQFKQHSFERFQIRAAQNLDVPYTRMSDWHRLGPFLESDRNKAFQNDFGPEKAKFQIGATFESTTEQGTQPLKWEHHPEYVDGSIHEFPTGTGVWYLHRTIFPTVDRIKISLGSDDAVAVWVDGQQVFANDVARPVAANQDAFEISVTPGKPAELLVKIVNYGGGCGFYFDSKRGENDAFALYPLWNNAEDTLDASENDLIKQAFLRQHNESTRELVQRLAVVNTEIETFEKTLPTTLVSREMVPARPAYFLKRGEYDKPDKDRGEMTRRVPDWLPPMPDDAPNDRMGIALWLIGENHPLMARVTVNRFWQQVFGRGIVKTSEDFGVQGALPTHPELLDWLAIDFREHGWDVKRLMKQLVMSETYRQSSFAPESSWKKDPTNRFLSRGPRYRLDAESLRDRALAVSGLLVEKIGGPGVKPPQPDGLWEAVGYVGSNTAKFVADMDDEKIHRRSLYTFWKRTAPPPQMSTFDSPSREECVIRRERTNTPLQALLLLNDPQFVECAKSLAARFLTGEQAETKPEQVVSGMFEQALGRPPSAEELNVLAEFHLDRTAYYESNPDQATALISTGAEMPQFAELKASDRSAAWAATTATANVILNLDEFVSKQ